MYKLEFTLKQHTPLIHFQHDQAGATLRATEVKPKLDRFLRGPFKQIRPDIYQKYQDLIALIPDETNKENKPSPYKLLIQPINENEIEKFVIASYIPRAKISEYENKKYVVLDMTPYFADNNSLKNGELEKAKLGVMLKGNALQKIVLRFYNSRWEELLNEALPSFFVSTNFGSRQSKGFGCFLPSNISQHELENMLRRQFPVVFRSKDLKDLKSIFIEIDSIYKILKSGDRNHDSELRKYFNDYRPVIEWEKPAIQEKVAEISGLHLRINSKTNNRQFVRALLGLPEIYEYPKHGGVKVQVKFISSEQDKIDQIKIERYGSPLLFIVFNKIIYLTINENLQSKFILNKSFSFEFAHFRRKLGTLQGSELKTPIQFDLTDFLTSSMSEQVKWIKI